MRFISGLIVPDQGLFHKNDSGLYRIGGRENIIQLSRRKKWNPYKEAEEQKSRYQSKNLLQRKYFPELKPLANHFLTGASNIL